VLYPLLDHLGSVTAIADYDAASESTSVVNEKLADVSTSVLRKPVPYDRNFSGATFGSLKTVSPRAGSSMWWIRHFV
jgi:hypothetical protein